MSKDILWVAGRDGKGWNSSRTRDLVDVAFTVYKETPSSLCQVDIRQPLDSSDPKSRAVQVIGRVFFADHIVAKKKIAEMVEMSNSSGFGQEEARKLLVTTLLSTTAIDDRSLMYFDGVCTTQAEWIAVPTSSTVPVAAPVVPAPVDETVSKMDSWLKLASDLAESMSMLDATEDPAPLPTSGTYRKVEPTEEFNVAEYVESLPLEIDLSAGGMYVPPTTEEVINAMLEEIKEETAAQQETLQTMVEMVEEIQAEVEPVFDPSTWSVGDPVPAGYLVFGGKLKKMEWPK